MITVDEAVTAVIKAIADKKAREFDLAINKLVPYPCATYDNPISAIPPTVTRAINLLSDYAYGVAITEAEQEVTGRIITVLRGDK